MVFSSMTIPKTKCMPLPTILMPILGWSNYFCVMLGCQRGGQDLRCKLICLLLHFIFQCALDFKSLTILMPTPAQHSTFNSERMASGEYNLAQYQADRYEYETFGGSQLHPLMNLSTDQVCTYQAQLGDPRPILFISSLQDVAASMSISKIGNICAASVLKQRLVCIHDFELSKNSTISSFCADPKYKDNKNRQYD
jgi:hypothetical protein